MKLKSLRTAQQGFTLIELLVVIGILAILLGITLFALNPSEHFKGARDTQRRSDVTAILDSIYEYEAAHTGNLPPSVSGVTAAVALAGVPGAQSPTGTSFSTPNLTFTGLSGNIITTAVGNVTVSGCSQSADNGTFAVVSGTATTLVVNNAGASGTSATGCSITNWTGRVNLCSDVVPTYLANLPMDPSGSTGTVCVSTYNTGYTIASSSGRFTVAAPSAEGGSPISVTR